MESDAPRIGILVDEALAMAIDEDAPGQAVRWAERQRASKLLSLVVAAPAPTPMRIPRP